MSVENFQAVLEQIDRVGRETQREYDRMAAERRSFRRKLYAGIAVAAVAVGGLVWCATKK